MSFKVPVWWIFVAAYGGAGVNHAIIWGISTNAAIAWSMLQILIWPLWLYASHTGNLWLVSWLPADVFFTPRGR